MTQDPDTSLLGRTPGLPAEHFQHDGLITKHAIRAVALASLRPMPDELLWDLGTGAGSIAVEWCRAHPSNRAIGIERRQDRAENALANAAALTLPGQFEVRVGNVGELLSQLPVPNAVFIGGGASQPVIEHCLATLPVGGRLVVHGVTLETESLLTALHAQHGGELCRIQVSTADAIGRLRGWAPARPVTCWSLTI